MDIGIVSMRYAKALMEYAKSMSYGETKQLHVHTHMIMSWGGIDNGNKIVVPEHDYVHIPLSARCSVTSLKMR